MFRSAGRFLRDERGITLVVVAGSMVVILAFAALAIDIGELTTARTEAQRAADGAALAGAGHLIFGPNDGYGAELEAVKYGGYNTVILKPVAANEMEVSVITGDQTVGVWVNRTGESGIATNFARIFGVDRVDVRAYAKARVVSTDGVAKCLLPLALPDKWNEVGGDPEDFNPELGDTYAACPGAGCTGYQFPRDWGRRIRIKEGGGPGTMNPSWYFPWRPPGDAGAADYRANIWQCRHPDIEYRVGSIVSTEPGNMIGPTRQGFQKLYDLDPTHVWNENANDNKGCITAGFSSRTCVSSERVRPMPMFDPTLEPPNGKKEFAFTNFVGVFVERQVGNEVYVRLMNFTGPAGDGLPGDGFAGKAAVLIE